MRRLRSPRFPKPKPAVVVRRERRARVTTTAHVVRAAVWRQDQGQCRACRRRRGHEVHHVRHRSQLGRWATENCVLLCQRCHQDVHAHILTITGTDADARDGLAFVWRAWW